MSTLRAQGVRKRVAKALSDLEGGRKSAGGRAEQLARQAIKDLRAAADAIEKRLDLTGSGSRSRAAKKAATTRKRAAAKRSSAAKRGAATRARKATGAVRKAATRSTGARKSSGRKTTARKTGGRKSSARKSARKR